MAESSSDIEVPGHLLAIGVPQMWEQTRGGGVGIALFDSGVDTREGPAQRQLGGAKRNQGNKLGVVDGRDYTHSRHHLAIVDEYGHGTKMAAILCARSVEDRLAWAGCCGVAPGSAVLNLKIGFSDGSISPTAVLEAAAWISKRRQPRIRVALLAFDWETWKTSREEHQDALKEALDQLIKKDVLPVVAAGDSAVGVDLDQEKLVWSDFSDRIVVVGASRLDEYRSPEEGEARLEESADPCHAAHDAETENKGGTNKKKQVRKRKARYLTETSNYGPGTVHIAAPGEWIPTLTPMGVGMAFGTSAAAALVAGSAALLAAKTEPSSAELRTALLASSRKAHDNGQLLGVEEDRLLTLVPDDGASSRIDLGGG